MRSSPRLNWLKPVGFLLILVFIGSSCTSAPNGAAARSDAARDFTFFLFSDIHVGAENLKAKPPANPRQYDVLSCGVVCWVVRVRGDQRIGAHFKGSGWNADPAAVFVKSLRP